MRKLLRKRRVCFKLTQNRSRYPISAERVPDPRGFNFTAKNVAMQLDANRSKREVLYMSRGLAKIAASHRLDKAILDRLLHHSHVIAIRGESYRPSENRRSVI